MQVPGTRVRHHEPVPAGEDEAEVEFRLAPLEDEPSPPPGEASDVAEPEIALQESPTTARGVARPKLEPIEDGPRFGAAPVAIPEELLADRAPIPLDPNFVPAGGAGRHDQISQDRITARARMYRRVRTLLSRIEWIENWLYVVSIISLMVSITGLLIVNRPLAHFGASWVLLCSLLLAALGGIEVVVKPFQYGIFGTSWKTMKKQIRHALAAFIPLIVLFLSYLFIGPIRDYFLNTAEARQERQMSSISEPILDPTIRSALAFRTIESRAHP